MQERAPVAVAEIRTETGIEELADPVDVPHGRSVCWDRRQDAQAGRARFLLLGRRVDLGGRRAVVTNVVVNLDSPASPTGPDDPYNLKCPKDVARERLHHLLALGYDDIILVPPRHDAAYLQELRELTLSAR